MAELYLEITDEEEKLRSNVQRNYWDRKTYNSFEEQQQATLTSSTLYVGNLSFFTSEAQIYELFSRVGNVKRVIMGLDRFKKTPCGFCFVEYNSHEEAVACSNFLSETKLDNRVIRCEMDGGFREGRQYGRGPSGGQVRDDRRSKDEYDPGRGGYGKQETFEGGSHFRRNGPLRKRLRHDSSTGGGSGGGDEFGRKSRRFSTEEDAKRSHATAGHVEPTGEKPLQDQQQQQHQQPHHHRHRQQQEEQEQQDAESSMQQDQASQDEPPQEPEADNLETLGV